jgi:hypothetical protein
MKTCKIHGQLDKNQVYLQHSKYKDKKYPYYQCKQCVSIKKKKLYALDPEKHIRFAKATQKKYREKVMKKQNEYHIKKYMPLDKYQEILVKQENKCAICKKEEASKHQNGKVKRLSIDHCHSTNKIRGLLCKSCNIGIGELKDSIELLESAIRYLKASIL